MQTSKVTKAFLCSLVSAAGLAQTPAKVDFSRDVIPILRQNCVPCHGPTQQNSGMRLDRKSSVLGRRGVVPGSAENSFLFHRISGTDYGAQMPPTGPLRAEQINIIKQWIDQGADWPDALANEADAPPPNPKAVAMVEALRTGDLPAFDKFVTGDAKLLNARGPEGSTPFMYAVLYTGAPVLEQLLKKGADPNKANDAGATALIWAATDLEKIRVLVNHDANVNARSADLRTPLMMAARRPGNSATVKFLLDHGANPNPNNRPDVEGAPLIDAANAGDPASMELLLAKGAETKRSGEVLLENALTEHCAKCFELIVAKELDKQAYSAALPNIASLGDANAVRIMLDHGADINAFDPLGRTPLMYAVASDLLPLDEVKLLVERGADINAKDQHKKGGDSGLTVLDIARLHGETPIVAFLEKAGAKGTQIQKAALQPRRANTIQAAVQSSLPLIQMADANFVPKAACVSCHNNSFAAMAVGAARNAGFKVDEKMSKQQVQANVIGLEKLRDDLHQSIVQAVGDTFGSFVVGNILVGLHAEHYQADLNTDTAAIYLKSHQRPDGEWPYGVTDNRPPICSDYIGQTAIAMRALQLYAPKPLKAEYDKAVQLAANWIVKAKAPLLEDRIWKLQGLAWANTDKVALQAARRDLLAKQRPDGGWADLDSMESTVYTTGRALVALHSAGMAVSDPVYQRGIQFLLRTQNEDGSWYVRSRAMTLQPYFDSGFPHGFDQWISAAGTSYATMALAAAAPAKTTVAMK
ncbi:MAG TPA: ankyrin repeat domain-containing protein [Bryobacteraceae bacterium]|nr:ankyrin repeat domain-containing protein [Bryobacteraceae bacterium]